MARAGKNRMSKPLDGFFGPEAIPEALLSGRDVLAVGLDSRDRANGWQRMSSVLPGLTLVFVPLTPAVFRDVDDLCRRGMAAACLEPRAPLPPELERLRLLCVDPEALEGPRLLELAGAVPISLVAVEEAQRLSDLSEDFCPAYGRLGDLLRVLPNRPPVAVFTPAADLELQDSLRELLLLREPLPVAGCPDRPGLCLDVAAPRRRDSWLLDFLQRRREGTGLVLCPDLREAGRLQALLAENGLTARLCQPGQALPDSPAVLLAQGDPASLTLPSLDYIIHNRMPPSLAAYARELAPAGREERNVDCVLLFSPADAQAARLALGPARQGEAEVCRLHALTQLDRVVDYCKTTDCLKDFLRRQLWQTGSAACGCCGNCRCKYVSQDITEDARRILTAVGHIEARFPFGLARAVIVQLLQGSRDRRVLQMQLDQLEDFGTLNHLSRPQLRAYIDALLREGCLYLTDGSFPVLRRTDMGRKALEAGERFYYKVRMKKPRPGESRTQMHLSPEDAVLARQLQQLRTSIAHELKLPAYAVFSNATLADMAVKKPRNREEFLTVSGVGRMKADRYAPRFIDFLTDWLDRQKNRK